MNSSSSGWNVSRIMGQSCPRGGRLAGRERRRVVCGGTRGGGGGRRKLPPPPRQHAGRLFRRNRFVVASHAGRRTPSARGRPPRLPVSFVPSAPPVTRVGR